MKAVRMLPVTVGMSLTAENSFEDYRNLRKSLKRKNVNTLFIVLNFVVF